MIAKIHKTLEGRTILAVCDSNLKGKKFEQGELQLDISSEFYAGKEIDEKEIKKLFKVVQIVNLVGKKSVELGMKAGIVSKEFVLKVKGIPHAQGIVARE